MNLNCLLNNNFKNWTPAFARNFWGFRVSRWSWREHQDSIVFNQGGSRPLQPLGRRSALHPGSFSLDAQRKGTKRNAPRRLPPNFLPEAGPTPAPQLPTGRIEQVRPRYRQKIRLITPSWGGRTNQRQTKTPRENPEGPKKSFPRK